MFKDQKPLYVDVIVPLALPQLFTYQVPEELKAVSGKGQRAIVQFGKKKLYTALIYRLHHDKPQHYDAKPLAAVLDNKPIIKDIHFDFWQWISDYYLCTLGDVYKAAVPSGMKLESESKVLKQPDSNVEVELKPQDIQLLSLLDEKKALSIDVLSKQLKQNSIIGQLNRLINLGLVSLEEQLRNSYKPKYEEFIRINFEINCSEALQQAFSKLERAPKQLSILMTYIHLARQMEKKAGSQAEVPQIAISKKQLLETANASSSALKSLVDKDLLSVERQVLSRLAQQPAVVEEQYTLSDAQNQAFLEVKQHFEQKNVVLLHGVTSSGKTEVYIRLIADCMAQGKQVLYLLPEIALTIQIINRLTRVFGDRVGVYHSRFNDAERVELWQNLAGNDKTDKPPYQLILGVRSSVFLPFSNLGLLIVDEEHENTYKQFDPAPRYHARDAAIMLAHLHQAKVLLGTATPSVESYHNALTGKYALVELNIRYREIQLPDIQVSDVRLAKRRKQMKSFFTPQLLDSMQTALEQREQVILFQNRRGFSPFLECDTCGWIPVCKQCDVSMTYHKHINQLTCHYCGYSYTNPGRCLACESPALHTRGFGTEKIEDEVALLFPDARIARMDLDTTRSRKAYQTIISDFESHKVDILIGTQMITKGLDFDKVSLVGIMNADAMLHYPDFRAYERSFQLMAQVAGRAGRKNKRGIVIIQSSKPDNPVIRDVIHNDYRHFFETQLKERRQFHYPPFYRLVRIVCKHKKQDIVNQGSKDLATLLRQMFGHRVLGPEAPPVGRIQNYYLKNILLKVEKDRSVSRAKQLLVRAIGELKNIERYRYLQIQVDVDPM